MCMLAQISMNLTLQTMSLANPHSPSILLFPLLIRVHSSVHLPAELKEKMLRKRGTQRRGSTSHGGGRHKENLEDTYGFVT